MGARPWPAPLGSALAAMAQAVVFSLLNIKRLKKQAETGIPQEGEEGARRMRRDLKKWHMIIVYKHPLRRYLFVVD